MKELAKKEKHWGEERSEILRGAHAGAPPDLQHELERNVCRMTPKL